jgi:hypothetical protein
MQRPVSVTGTIVKVDWWIPPVFVHLKEEDKATGKITTWAFEAESHKYLEKAFGLSKEMLKEGSTITIVGYSTRRGADVSIRLRILSSPLGFERKTQAAIVQFEFADGKKIPILPRPGDSEAVTPGSRDKACSEGKERRLERSVAVSKP